MINKFLKAKHWQLFILTFGIPMILQIVMMVSVFSNFVTQKNPDPTTMFNYMKFFPFIFILFVAIFLGWFWSVAIGLQKKVPENVSMKVRKFKVFFFIPIVYMSVFFSFFFFSMNTLFPNPEPNFGFVGGLFAIIIPLHLFAMFCILYSLYFVAKTIKTVELQRAVTFSDFAGEFFLIWFYPIGIWIIQPKINKMIE
jgi:magnesium-transporting ATPase (P-type)